jgi:AcrR family transcriptional regulator
VATGRSCLFITHLFFLPESTDDDGRPDVVKWKERAQVNTRKRPAGRKRKRNARGSGDQLRQQILEAAIRLLERLAPGEPFSLRAVAKEANISAPSVYLQFADKDVLLLAVLEQLFAELIAQRRAAEEEAAQAGGGAWERLLATVLASVKFGIQRPGHYKVLYEGRVIPRLDDPKAMAFGKPIQARAVELIREVLAAQPGRQAESPERMSLLLWAGIHGLVSLRINKPTFDWPETSELATEMAHAIVRPLPAMRTPTKKRN